MQRLKRQLRHAEVEAADGVKPVESGAGGMRIRDVTKGNANLGGTQYVDKMIFNNSPSAQDEDSRYFSNIVPRRWRKNCDARTRQVSTPQAFPSLHPKYGLAKRLYEVRRGWKVCF